MKLNKIISMLFVALMALAMVACDDNNKTPLTATAGSIENAAYNTLTFEWNAVNGAVQYSYQLVEDATGNIIVTDITQMPTATISGLKPDTDYTLTVLAYAAIGSDQTTSEPIVLHGRTAALVAVDAPQPVMSREINTIYFDWTNVEGADDYYWELLDANHQVLQSGQSRQLYAEFPFSDMPDGNYVFTIKALCSADGMMDSPTVSVPFTFERESEEIWRNEGKYTSGLTGTTWNVTIIAYDDNSYVLKNWYGADGYDFKFSLDEADASDMFKISSELYTYNAADQSYAVPTGIASPSTVYVFPASNQCAFAGNSGKGSVLLQVSDGTTTAIDRLTWGALTIDDLVAGQWLMHTTCDFYGDWIDNTKTVTFTKVNDTTISIPTPEIWGNDITYLQYRANVVIDFDTMDYTVQPVSNVAGYYTFASANGETTPLTGTINNASWTLSAWDFWYSGWSYVSSSTVTFTRP